MYPIDAIKVCNSLYPFGARLGIKLMTVVDSNANHQSDTLRGLQWHDTGRISNSHRGGNPQLMARNVECGCGSRLVFPGWARKVKY